MTMFFHGHIIWPNEQCGRLMFICRTVQLVRYCVHLSIDWSVNQSVAWSIYQLIIWSVNQSSNQSFRVYH